jgi:hypothetical protein
MRASFSILLLILVGLVTSGCIIQPLEPGEELDFYEQELAETEGWDLPNTAFDKNRASESHEEAWGGFEATSSSAPDLNDSSYGEPIKPDPTPWARVQAANSPE